MSQTLADIVALHPLFAGMSDDVAEVVAGCATNVVFGAGRLLLKEGEPARTFYLIRHGRVALEVAQPGGPRLLIETLGPGSPLGWSWLFPPYRSRLDARAIEAVRAIAVDAHCLRAKADRDPAFGYQLMQRFSAVILERLQATRLRLLDVYSPALR